jgi:hypothetical protein
MSRDAHRNGDCGPRCQICLDEIDWSFTCSLCGWSTRDQRYEGHVCTGGVGDE